MPPFPLIPKIPDQLQKIMPLGRLVVFIGAGVSCLTDYPNWDELANRALEELAKDDAFEFSYADKDCIRSLPPRKKLSIAIDIWKTKKSVNDLLKIINRSGS